MQNPVPVALTMRSALGVLALLGAAWLGLRLIDVLVLVAIAIILAAALSPAVWRFHRVLGWPRVASVAAVFGILVGVVFLLGLLVVPAIVEQASTLATNLPAYVTKVRGAYAWAQGLDTRFHVLPNLDAVVTQVSARASTLISSSLGFAGKAANGLANVSLVLVSTFFLLLEGPVLRRGLLALVPPRHRAMLGAQFEPITLKLGGYVQGLTMTIGFLAAYLALALSLAGVPLALVLALLAGCLEIIPMVGSLLGSIPAILIALTVSWQLAAITVGIFLLGNFLQGNFVAPYVFGRTVELSPVLVMFALLVGAELLGFTGALIAVPVLAAIQVLVQNLYLEPMAATQANEERIPVYAAPLPVPRIQL